MQFNFFGWLREGVRQSVLLGVSDAVESLGLPPDAEESNQQLLTLLRAAPDRAALPAAAGKANAGRRLGRSLKSIAGEESQNP
jgi:hypothetical protein